MLADSTTYPRASSPWGPFPFVSSQASSNELSASQEVPSSGTAINRRGLRPPKTGAELELEYRREALAIHRAGRGPDRQDDFDLRPPGDPGRRLALTHVSETRAAKRRQSIAGGVSPRKLSDGIRINIMIDQRRPIDILRKPWSFSMPESPARRRWFSRRRARRRRRPGSAPRSRPAGGIWGTIGGGLVEAEAQRRAGEVCRSQMPGVFDFRLDSASAAEAGAICGGWMRILLAPVTAGDRDCSRRPPMRSPRRRRRW